MKEKKLPRRQRRCTLCGDYVRTVQELVDHLRSFPHAMSNCPCSGIPNSIGRERRIEAAEFKHHITSLLKKNENIGVHIQFHMLGRPS